MRSSTRRGAIGAAALAAGAASWGWFESGWVRLRTLDVRVRGLADELDGLRIMHLSDFHLGVPSRSWRAIEQGVEWARERDPDLVAITGDLLSRPSGEPRLRSLIAGLPRCYAVLGNHDYADSRDPFSKPAALTELEPATLLRDDSRTIELRGKRVQIAGVDPVSYRRGNALPERLTDRDADLRILLCHYPHVVDRLTPGAFDLVLAGHLHSGQIALPYGPGKLRFSHVRWTYVEGLYERPAAILHVSPGLGTTFVPFRFFARPEATELVLHCNW
ncbi:MAG: metallophosphoesterase [Actinomycetota bacterium]|nr:metallophosphoesterase [Actinomycetota bacterium]